MALHEQQLQPVRRLSAVVVTTGRNIDGDVPLSKKFANFISMETFIPIIIAIVVFAFQAYANYQKEQDKARKRRPAQPPLPEDNANYIPPVPAAAPASAPAVKPEFEYYSGVLDPTTHNSRAKQQERPLIPQRLVVDTSDDVLPALDASGFDLRDAVIKSIILERPYK